MPILCCSCRVSTVAVSDKPVTCPDDDDDAAADDCSAETCFKSDMTHSSGTVSMNVFVFIDRLFISHQLIFIVKLDFN